MHYAQHNSEYMPSKLDPEIHVSIWKWRAHQCLPNGITWMPFGLEFTKIQNEHFDWATSDAMLII